MIKRLSTIANDILTVVKRKKDIDKHNSQILNTETNILFIISQQYLNEIRFIGKQNKVEIYSPNDKTLDEIHGHLIRQMDCQKQKYSTIVEVVFYLIERKWKLSINGQSDNRKTNLPIDGKHFPRVQLVDEIPVSLCGILME